MNVSFKIIFLLGFVGFIPGIHKAQCTYNNTISPFNADLTPSGPGTSDSYSCAWAGDYFTLNVINGEQYKISTCNSVNSNDPFLTLYNSSGSSVLGYNDNFCGSYAEITYTATATETIHILIDQAPGCSHSSICIDIAVTYLNTSMGFEHSNDDMLENHKRSDNMDGSIIFPNPGPGKFIYKQDTATFYSQIHIMNQLGQQKAIINTNTASTSIDLRSQLESGLYYVITGNKISKLLIRK